MYPFTSKCGPVGLNFCAEDVNSVQTGKLLTQPLHGHRLTHAALSCHIQAFSPFMARSSKQMQRRRLTSPGPLVAAGAGGVAVAGGAAVAAGAEGAAEGARGGGDGAVGAGVTDSSRLQPLFANSLPPPLPLINKAIT